MTDIAASIEIPNRPLFKAAEVCDLAKVQPYVLRSWEAEFKDLGISRSGSSARVYRREDVARVLRIRHLLLVEGLTLAGVRRRLEEEAEPSLEDQFAGLASAPAVAAPVAPSVRARISDVKRGLRSLLELLDASVADAASVAVPDEPIPAEAFELAPKTSSPRRKRSA